ncbi:hypothetical protein D3C84_787390 [compost metagenome]
MMTPARAPSQAVSIHIKPAQSKAIKARLAFIAARRKSRCKGLVRAWRYRQSPARPSWIASLSSSISLSCSSIRACSQRRAQASERRVAGMSFFSCSACSAAWSKRRCKALKCSRALAGMALPCCANWSRNASSSVSRRLMKSG